MTTEATQFSLMRMKTKEINNFLIWRTDWEKWKRLKEFLASGESPFMTTFIGAASASPNDDGDSDTAIGMNPADEDTVHRVRASFSNVTLKEIDVKKELKTGFSSFDGEQLDAEKGPQKSSLDFTSLNKANAFGRQNKEDKYKLELLLTHPKGTLFRTVAKDISLTGTFSERIIPDEFHRDVFSLVIINNFINDNEFKRVTLKAKVVITDASVYLQYVKPTEDEKNKLRALLDYYVRSQKNV